MTKIKAMIESLSTRLVINISDMRDWDGPATEVRHSGAELRQAH